jgi:hypothetical protein
MKLDRQYERFRGGPAKPSQERIHVTINHKGVIYLNRNAHRLLGKPEATYLYFNRERDEIALEPTNPRFADAFPLKRNSQDTGYLIQANPVIRHFGIRLNGTNLFIDPQIDQHGILHLKLADIVQTSRLQRQSSGKKSDS